MQMHLIKAFDHLIYQFLDVSDGYYTRFLEIMVKISM